MNRVETFTANSLHELQVVINLWCADEQLKPISISITKSTSYFYAAVVVEDLNND